MEHPHVREILKGLPPQLMWDATQRWFRNSASTATLDKNQSPLTFRVASAREPERDPLDEDFEDPLDSEDPLAQDSSTGAKSLPASKSRYGTPATPLEHDPVNMQPDGGWYIDDTRMAVTYRGHGHADPVLKAAIELAAGLSEDSSIRRELLGSGPALACIECHRGANANGGFNWKATRSFESLEGRFTKFSHQPHMNLPTLADCKHCHQLNDDFDIDLGSPQATTVSLSDRDISNSPKHDFEPLTRQACATCHTANAAGDACIKCHIYHR
jgi:hypothetical protein